MIPDVPLAGVDNQYRCRVDPIAMSWNVEAQAAWLVEFGSDADEHLFRLRRRRETVEHPFGTIKSWMGSTHFQMKTLPRVRTEMAMHVLAYNLKRVINIIGIAPLIAAMRAA